MPRPVVVAAMMAALVFVPPARAHVIASPTFLESGSTQAFELSAPNEGDAPMTTFVVTAPPSLEIVSAEETEGWTAAVSGQTATWSGGSLPALLSETFGLRVRPAELGQIELEVEQRYADGEVRWPVALTIVPGSGEASSNAGGSGLVVGVIVAAGVLVAGAVALLARRRSG